MNQNKKNVIYTCVIIPSAVLTGTISGISGVIASYFFKPIWNKITKLWEKEKIINEQNTNRTN